MPRSQRIALRHLDPGATNPALLIDREAERERLYAPLKEYITDPVSLLQRFSMAVIGEKGVGKSIFTLAVLKQLREEHSDQLVTVEVDCRRHRGWRELLFGVCDKLKLELESLSSVGQKLPEYAVDAASLLRDLARLDHAQEATLEEYAQSTIRKGKLGGAWELAKLAKLELSLDLTITETHKSSVSGTRLLDEDRLTRMISALFTDLARDGLRAVVFIDNLDEVNHDSYIRAKDRDAVRREVEGLLKLEDAPIALVLNARTYFAGVFNRTLPRPIRLEPLPGALLRDVLRRRLEDETPAVHAQMATPEVESELVWLSELPGTTPFEFLYFVFERAQEGSLSPTEREPSVQSILLDCYPNLELEELCKIVRAFDGQARISRDDLEKALGSDYLFEQAMLQQAVLPVDFWVPKMFSLDARLRHLRALLA